MTPGAPELPLPEASRSGPGGAATAAPCPVCGTATHRELHRFARHRVLHCRRCSLVRVDPPPEEPDLLAYAHAAHLGECQPETVDYFRPRDPEDRGDPVVRRHHRLLDRLEESAAGGRLLDVGCGNGDFAAAATLRGWRVVALDGSPTAARAAGRRGAAGLAAAIPTAALAPGRFDAITMLDFLEHVPRPGEAVAAARRLLRPGGLLHVESPNHASLLCWLLDRLGRLPVAALRDRVEAYYHPSHPVVFDPPSLSRLLAAHGFEPVARGTSDPILARLRLALPERLALAAIGAASGVVGGRGRVWMLARLALTPRRPPRRRPPSTPPPGPSPSRGAGSGSGSRARGGSWR